MRLNSKMAELEKLNANARQALMMAADAAEGRRRRQGGAVQRRRRDDRQPADPGREGRRRPEDDGPRVGPGVRPGQGRRRSRTAACCSRSSPSKNKLLSQLDQAKMQEEMNKAMAQLQRDGRRRRAHAQRGAAEDRGPLRQGQGVVRAARVVGRSRGSSRSSRPPPTSRPTAASANCAPSSASTAAKPAVGAAPAAPAEERAPNPARPESRPSFPPTPNERFVPRRTSRRHAFRSTATRSSRWIDLVGDVDG